LSRGWLVKLSFRSTLIHSVSMQLMVVSFQGVCFSITLVVVAVAVVVLVVVVVVVAVVIIIW